MLHASSVHGQPSPAAREYLAGWQRARAALDNWRKQAAAASVAERARARAGVIEPLLTLSDNFAAMTQHVPKELEHNPWTAGVLHIARQLDSLLAEYNVERIAVAGELFDPSQHEAIEQVTDAVHPSGRIVEVVQSGYRIGDRVVRPAKVRVAA